MSTKEYPSVGYIRQCFRYEDGKLFWLIRPKEHFLDSHAWKVWNTKHSGKEAGHAHACHNCKRHVVKLKHKTFLGSILTWAIVHGHWPAYEIDHKDRNSLNDSIGNLREANEQQQHANRGKSRLNTTGYKGVTWGRNGKYVAVLVLNRRHIYLGRFDDPKEAHAAYCEANLRYNGEFAFNG